MFESPVWNPKKDENLYKTAGSLHLRKYGQFFESLAEKSWKNDSLFESFLEGPIRLCYRAVEDVSILSLIEMENKMYSKILATIAGMCKEIRLLKIEAQSFYRKFFMHGEKSIESSNNFINNALLSDLQNLFVYVKRIFKVVQLSAQQLAGLGNKNHDIYLPAFIEHFLDLFIILLTIDNVIDSQPQILDQWKKYRIQVHTVMQNPSQFDISEDKLETFEKLLKDLQETLLKKDLFSKSIDCVMEVKLHNIPNMNDQLMGYLKNLMSDIESKPGDNAAINKSWIRVNVGIVVASKLFGACDKKLIKRIVEANKKYYAVTLVGNVIWIPSVFLNHFLPKEAGSIVSNQIGEKILLSRTQRLPQSVNTLVYRAMIWCVELQSLTTKADFQVADIAKKRILLTEIFTLFLQIKESIFFVTNLYAALSKPMSKSIVHLICRLIEVQRALQTSFYMLGPVIVQSQLQVAQLLSHQILTLLENARKGLMQKDKGYSKEKLDALSLVGLSVKLLSGPGSADRRLIARCALASASQLADTFKEEEIIKLRFLLDSYDIIIDLQDLVAEMCDYSILLYHQNIVPAYFSSVHNSNFGISHIVHIFNAFNSAIEDQESSETTETKVEEFKQHLIQYIMEPACREIETSLRLHVHAHLNVDSTNPFHVGIRDGSRITRSVPLPLSKTIFFPKRFVENYLDDKFYNHTTVALHDWKTYRTMHTLANYKLGLETVQNHLPTQTLEQGVDALEIMRNIHVFVSKYLYNLNTQTFIEQSSSNKHLNTIGIRHIANSIRTHGTGIMSTTVNFVYQFLRVKLHTFSQFLFDEHIKSRLMRDIRFIKTQRENGATPYTYVRAEQFQKGIRKLGGTGGMSYLDQFRQLITQIGNALGYVRLIRSGGLHASSNAISFLPNINSSTPFESMCKNVNYSESTQAAARRLEEDITDLVRNFTEGIQYFKLLVDVFASAFRDPKSYHLHQFYAIIPPLTLSFVDNSMSNKEKMYKKNQTGAAFTDDGFAMGVAYINALLDQSLDLDGLHWFKTVEEYMNQERSAADAKIEHNDEKLQQTRALTLKRIEERSAEFQLLYYSLSGARVFFKQPES
ncbi:WASH complex subunit 4 [Prorops nasuta]|uniref:WASH complex subunit 4 n=1 Tax=Prorops nasuta TaxID=863751 RepID=UPI0034CD9981